MWRLLGVLLGFVAGTAGTFVAFRTMRPVQAEGRLTKDDLRRVMRPWHTAVSFFVVVICGAAGAAADESNWLPCVLLLTFGLTLAAGIGKLKWDAAREIMDANNP